jgi:hypothetical protein
MRGEENGATTESSRVSNDYKDPEDVPLDKEVTMADFLNMLRRLSEDLRALTRAIAPASPKYQRCDNLVDTLEGLRTVTADVVRAVHHVHDKL